MDMEINLVLYTYIKSGFYMEVYMVELRKKCRCGRYLFLCNNMEICLVCNIIKNGNKIGILRHKGGDLK